MPQRLSHGASTACLGDRSTWWDALEGIRVDFGWRCRVRNGLPRELLKATKGHTSFGLREPGFGGVWRGERVSIACCMCNLAWTCRTVKWSTARKRRCNWRAMLRTSSKVGRNHRRRAAVCQSESCIHRVVSEHGQIHIANDRVG